MTDTGFTPAESKRSRIAPTGDMKSVRGIVHDPTARRMGGVAGHAGLFSTAADLATFCRMILGGGAYRGVRILSPLAVAKMTSRATPAEERNARGLGWDIDSSFSSNRGELLPIGSFGHTGFTGTSLWLDPASGMFVVFLSNRVHPDGKGDVTQLRGRVATIAASALMPRSSGRTGIVSRARISDPRDRRRPPRRPSVRPSPGSTCFVLTDLRCSKGKRIGLVTNHTGRARDGATTIDLLHNSSAANGTHAGGIVQPRTWHSRRARRERAVDDGRENRIACPFALRRHTAADRRDAARHRHAGRSICRTSARASTRT